MGLHSKVVSYNAIASMAGTQSVACTTIKTREVQIATPLCGDFFNA